jgi:hypothetical protein
MHNFALNQCGLARIFASTLMFFLCLPLPALARDKRYIAVSDYVMYWPEAKAWCADRGGKLPLINKKGSLGKAAVQDPGTVAIEGLGTLNTGPRDGDFTTPWSTTGLQDAWYWTGTENSDRPDSLWVVGVVSGGGNASGNAVVSPVDKYRRNRAICVP